MDVLEVTSYRDFLFTASKDRTIKLWDLVTAECMFTYSGHTDWVIDLKACSREQKLLPQTYQGRPLVLLSASADKTARLWNATTGECFQILSGGHDEAITSLVWVRNAVFTGSADCSIGKWCPDTGKLVGRCIGHRGTVWNIAQSAGFIFSCSDDLTARQWDQKTCQQVRAFRGHTGSVLDLCCVLSGGMPGFEREQAGMLCTVSEDGSLRIWRTGVDDPEGGKCVAMARGFEASAKMGEISDQATYRGVTQDVKKERSRHYAHISGWQWMGALHSVTANNKTGVIYTGSANGMICEFDLNQRSWQELEGTEGVMELVRNHYYMTEANQFANRHTGEKRLKGNSIYTLHLSEDGFLFAGSEDSTVHEFWVSKAGRDHELLQGNAST